MATKSKERQPLSEVLPPLIFGTATFTAQYNGDPFALDTVGLVQQALESGVRAFDTSPYYGPAEDLLGEALDTPEARKICSRSDYCLLTKVGRIAEAEFDYSTPWIRQSIQNSLERLRTDYLDVVYCHDVEFVSMEATLGAIKQLRKIRDREGTVKYIGISGYPVGYLCRIAERVFRETGEPLDAVMSYANFTVQNTSLLKYLPRFQSAGVQVVPNGSPLGMGLLRKTGPPIGLTDFHPAGMELREAVERASDYCDSHSEELEAVAIRYALERWLAEGSVVGSFRAPVSGVSKTDQTAAEVGGKRLGVSVIGVSWEEELTTTLQVWQSILDGLEENGNEAAAEAGSSKEDVNRHSAIEKLVEGIREELGNWVDYAWPSPPPGLVVTHRNTSPSISAVSSPRSRTSSISSSRSTPATRSPAHTPATQSSPTESPRSQSPRKQTLGKDLNKPKPSSSLEKDKLELPDQVDVPSST